MEIENIKIEDLIPYARNSRTHSDEQVAQVAASIKEFGFTNPVLIDADDGIIAGHGRVLAARKLKMHEVPCIRLGHLTESQKKAYIIADNKLALNSGWDEEMLKLELLELKELDFSIDVIGFNADEIMALLDEIQEKEKELKEETYSEIFNIIIECKDEEDQEKIFNRLDSEGYKCRVQSL